MKKTLAAVGSTLAYLKNACSNFTTVFNDVADTQEVQKLYDAINAENSIRFFCENATKRSALEQKYCEYEHQNQTALMKYFNKTALGLLLPEFPQPPAMPAHPIPEYAMPGYAVRFISCGPHEPAIEPLPAASAPPPTASEPLCSSNLMEAASSQACVIS